MSARRALLESLALVGTLAQVGIAAWALATLPDSIALSWGHDRSPSFGSKNMLLLVPAIGVLGYAISGLSSGRTPRLNLPVKITLTPENTPAVYALERELMLALKATIGVGFAAVEWQMVASAHGALSPGFTPTVVGMVAVPVALIVGYSVAIAKAAKPRPE